MTMCWGERRRLLKSWRMLYGKRECEEEEVHTFSFNECDHKQTFAKWW